MMKRSIVLGAALLLMGCAGQLLPDDYAGQTAVVKDSHANYVGTDGLGLKPEHVELFAMTEVNGKLIRNTLRNTTSATMQGDGRLRITGAVRKVPIEPLKVELVGEIYSTSPLLGPAAHRTQKTVSFTPVADETYVVRGKLGPSGSDVWIEAADGRRVTQ